MIDVAAAIIINENMEILIAKRKKEKSQGGLWEFPGGKVEKGETLEECLVRELKEEMEIDIEISEYFGENIYYYEKANIRLIAFKAKILGGNIKLIDHDEYAWAEINSLKNFEFAPADINFVKRIMETE